MNKKCGDSTAKVKCRCSQLLREIEGHDGFINSVCFDQEGKKFNTADSGIIRDQSCQLVFSHL